MTERYRAGEISADDIADALSESIGTRVPRPTAQQRAVIEADLVPALVVAGAGSGKTETMANRVLWLVANGLVKPAEVLGLTFTRKAAGELATRVRLRLQQLSDAGLTPPEHDLFDSPEISTYNAFASVLFRDNALVLGRDGDGAVLGEAAAWQLARSVVIRSLDSRLVQMGERLDAVTEATLSIARGIADNAADPEAVRAIGRRFRGFLELPPGGRAEYAGEVETIADVANLDILVDLAAEYDAAKRVRGVVDFADQVALALRALDRRPAMGDDLRSRYRVVLLDEYQDTSVVQTRLLARLFRGTAVMAVGDPNQSIYGWRGASAANLEQFSTEFGEQGARFALSTSWRNGERILDVANRLIENTSASSLVERLEARPGATDIAVDTVWEADVASEAVAVAGWLGDRFDDARLSGDPLPTAALLMRARKTQPFFLAALREAGVPYHVLGIGGLLAEPEVADLVSALRVIDDPRSGLELIRLLSGARWQLGVADLDGLRDIGRWLHDRDAAQQPLSDAVREGLRGSVAPSDASSIVDALDFVAHAPETHSALAAITPDGLARLRDAGHLFAGLRHRTGFELPDLVVHVARELRLDIEVAANELRTAGSANTDALLDALSGYLAVAESASLGGFLAWLREAEIREDLSPRPEDPQPGTVQVLTIHGAKGLEWDAVAVPRWVDEELPAKPLEGLGGWLGFGRFPWPARGDADQLPRFDLSAIDSRKAFKDERERFRELVGEHYRAEERRLAYVAVTRARDRLLLSGSSWSTLVKPRTASGFLIELAEAGVIPPLPDLDPGDENPLGSNADEVSWPHDPLGHRRRAVEQAAERVRAATPGLAGPWAREIELLVEERRRREAQEGTVELPVRVPASRFKDFVSDPDAVAASMRRPMPEKPYRATRLGTLFHAWVEERYGRGAGTDALDASAFELDSDGDLIDAERLAELQQIFESSPWAARRPVEVEREIQLPFAGHIVICKIDAVYADGDRFEVVDWKTGKAPKDEADTDRKQLQLALYRLAYAKWSGVPIERIDAAFYFVADDRIIRPSHIDSEEELLARWREAFVLPSPQVE